MSDKAERLRETIHDTMARECGRCGSYQDDPTKPHSFCAGDDPPTQADDGGDKCSNCGASIKRLYGHLVGGLCIDCREPGDDGGAREREGHETVWIHGVDPVGDGYGPYEGWWCLLCDGVEMPAMMRLSDRKPAPQRCHGPARYMLTTKAPMGEPGEEREARLAFERIQDQALHAGCERCGQMSSEGMKLFVNEVRLVRAALAPRAEPSVGEGEPVYQFFRPNIGAWVDCTKEQLGRAVKVYHRRSTRTLYTHPPVEPGAAREAVAIALREHFWLGRLGTNGAPCSWEEEEDSMKLNYLFRADAAITSQPAAPEERGEPRETWHNGLPYSALSVSEPKGRAVEWKVPLWQAVWYAAKAVGGDPDKHTVGVNGLSRITAVNKVEEAVQIAMRLAIECAAPASPEGVESETVCPECSGSGPFKRTGSNWLDCADCGWGWRPVDTPKDTNDWQARWDKAARSLPPEEYEKWVEGFIAEPGCPADLVERIRATEPPVDGTIVGESGGAFHVQTNRSRFPERMTLTNFEHESREYVGVEQAPERTVCPPTSEPTAFITHRMMERLKAQGWTEGRITTQREANPPPYSDTRNDVAIYTHPAPEPTDRMREALEKIEATDPSRHNIHTYWNMVREIARTALDTKEQG